MLYEFFMNPRGNQIIVNDIEKEEYIPFNPSLIELNKFLLNTIKNDYPEAFRRCSEFTFSDFKAVERFLRCNFSFHDNKPDIDGDGNLIIEFVPCPLRGICKEEGIICSPKFSSDLSSRELEVAKALASGMKIHEICDSLYISEATVKNHRNKIYKKLKINKIADLVNWAYKTKII